MTFSSAFYLLKQEMTPRYGEQESVAIAHEVMEDITKLSKIDRLMLKDQALNPTQQNELDFILDELLSGKPLQYVLGKSWFMGREFGVNEQVLIPRPETEELVIWILNELQQNQAGKSLLDIGTGSGCIPVSLKAELTEVSVEACDISAGALELAQENARKAGTEISFFRRDILDTRLWPGMKEYDVLVSNPPYIPATEAASMEEHVTLFEPHQALFVPDQDPLVFYKAVAALGRLKLKPGGAVFCEIHRDFPEATKAVFADAGYTHIELRKDMQDNWRMIRASF
ncbi:MAG: peptide chain release factor N(5)-glutamine methyltransferase [Chitinophagaceae bacterium]|nr:peptide chain release factor N(5)-glutamine methyltransferase [Chitinophagaceae bacterium]